MGIAMRVQDAADQALEKIGVSNQQPELPAQSLLQLWQQQAVVLGRDLSGNASERARLDGEERMVAQLLGHLRSACLASTHTGALSTGGRTSGE